MHKILVLDADQRSSLAVIRSLGLQKTVALYTSDSIPQAIGGVSRFSQGYFQSPSLEKQPLDYLNWLKNLQNNENFDFVFPITEPSSQLLLKNADTLKAINLPFASFDTVMSLANKANLMKIGQANQIPIPATLYYSNAAEVNAEQVSQFPIVIKPNLSRIFENDQWLHTSVQIAHSKQELDDYLKNSPWLQSHGFMLQEFIEGYGAGQFALYDQGKPVAFFEHQRLREKPPEGGVSVLCKSAPLNHSILKHTKALLKAVNWHGVAMIEYRIATDGTAYLMEVNTRFWGSLQLAVDSGVDFPAMLYKISTGQNIAPIKQYNTAQKLRWFLGDVDSLYLALKNKRYTFSQKLSHLLRFLTPHMFSTKHQVNRWNDLKPGWLELKRYIKDILG